MVIKYRVATAKVPKLKRCTQPSTKRDGGSVTTNWLILTVALFALLACDRYTPQNMAAVWMSDDELVIIEEDYIDDGNGTGTYIIEGDRLTAKIRMYELVFKIQDRNTLKLVVSPRRDNLQDIFKRVPEVE